MSYTIAMAGKGGTGKTTIAALIIRLIREKKLGSVLAIDADPNSNLAEAIGLKPGKSIGEILDEIGAHPEKVPQGMSKDRFIEYQVHSAIAEADGFDLLVMGRTEGPGCYCYVNNALRGVVDKLIKDYDYVVIDNEAGLEHLSRRTTRRADLLLVISTPAAVSIKSAKRINELTKELNIEIKKRFLLLNLANADVPKEKVADAGMEYLGALPCDNRIEEFSVKGSSLMKLDARSSALTTLRKLGEKIWN
jgi:CO dehydrogenase maturation factor